MHKLSLLIVGCIVSTMISDASLAQPRQHDDRGQQQGNRGQPQSGKYYYNGRWVDHNEWQRHSSERDRWARDYQQRNRSRNDSSSVIAGILGFALGAAIVGSQQQAEHARTADQSWDDYCAKKYRSYDRHSRTYMGYDGLRHYCQ